VTHPAQSRHSAGPSATSLPPCKSSCQLDPGRTETCGCQYRIGTSLTLTAEPGPDSVFLGWSGAGSGSDGFTMEIQGETYALATFGVP
jgi:hypothetical protein